MQVINYQDAEKLPREAENNWKFLYPIFQGSKTSGKISRDSSQGAEEFIPRVLLQIWRSDTKTVYSKLPFIDWN